MTRIRFLGSAGLPALSASSDAPLSRSSIGSWRTGPEEGCRPASSLHRLPARRDGPPSSPAHGRAGCQNPGGPLDDRVGDFVGTRRPQLGGGRQEGADPDRACSHRSRHAHVVQGVTEVSARRGSISSLEPGQCQDERRRIRFAGHLVITEDADLEQLLQVVAPELGFDVLAMTRRDQAEAVARAGKDGRAPPGSPGTGRPRSRGRRGSRAGRPLRRGRRESRPARR